MKTATNRKPFPLRVVPTKSEPDEVAPAVIEAGIEALSNLAERLGEEATEAADDGDEQELDFWAIRKTEEGILAARQLLRGEKVRPSPLEVAGALEAISWELVDLEEKESDRDTTAANWGVTIRQAGLEEAKRRLVECAPAARPTIVRKKGGDVIKAPLNRKQG
jgi:hypothetical protein